MVFPVFSHHLYSCAGQTDSSKKGKLNIRETFPSTPEAKHLHKKTALQAQLIAQISINSFVILDQGRHLI